MSYELRPITDDEVTAFRQALALGFGNDADPERDDRMRSLLTLDRTVAVFDGGEIVGTLGEFDLRLTVPGGRQVATAGTTMVTVRATHTRQGILRSMIRQHLDNAARRQDPVAALWASEPGIYERFGFGLAVESHTIKVDSRRITTPPTSADITVTMIPGSSVKEVVAPFWSQVAQVRAGFIDRGMPRWDAIIADPASERGGVSAGRHIVARRGDTVVGYLAYRQQEVWDDFVANGKISIGALVAADNDARRALWNFALDIDLFPNVAYWDGDVSDPLPFEASDARAVVRTMGDAIYVRIMDIEAALTTRTFEADGTLVLAVEDDMGYIGGTYRLTVVGGAATIESTTDAAHVTLQARDLGALYLGRTCVHVYSAMDRIQGSPQALRVLGQIFGTAQAPWCPEMF